MQGLTKEMIINTLNNLEFLSHYEHINTQQYEVAKQHGCESIMKLEKQGLYVYPIKGHYPIQPYLSFKEADKESLEIKLKHADPRQPIFIFRANLKRDLTELLERV